MVFTHKVPLALCCVLVASQLQDDEEGLLQVSKFDQADDVIFRQPEIVEEGPPDETDEDAGLIEMHRHSFTIEPIEEGPPEDEDPSLAQQSLLETAKAGCGDISKYPAEGYIPGNIPNGHWKNFGTASDRWIPMEDCLAACRDYSPPAGSSASCAAISGRLKPGDATKMWCNLHEADPFTDSSVAASIVDTSSWPNDDRVIYKVPSKCCFRGPLQDTVLAGWTGGGHGQASPNCFQSVQAAKDKCLATAGCGGITKQDWAAGVPVGNLSVTKPGQYCIGFAMRTSSHPRAVTGYNAVSYAKCPGAVGPREPCHPNKWVEYPGSWSSGGLGGAPNCLPLDLAKATCLTTPRCSGISWFYRHCGNNQPGAVQKYSLRNMDSPTSPRYDAWLGGNPAVTKTIRYEC